MHHLKLRSAVLITALCFLLAGTSFGQNITRQELSNFDQFLDSHPAIEKDLRSNPSLAKDSAYLTAHPELKNFVASHPGVREQIQNNPQRLINREREFEKSGKDITNAEVKNFDDFLDKHPAIEKDLEKNPSLANNSDYVAKHPELGQFLASHPQIRNDLRENPRGLLRREKKFDKGEAQLEKRQQKTVEAERREEQRERLREERREERRVQRDQIQASRGTGKHFR